MTKKTTMAEYRALNHQPAQPTLIGINRANHSNLGKFLEDALVNTHSEYEARKVASIDKHPVQWNFCNKTQFDDVCSKNINGAIAAKTNNGLYIKKVKSNIDFSGVVRGGKSVYFDAKQIQGKSFPLSNLEKHQLRRLLEKERIGAFSGIVLFFSELNRCFFVSASVLKRSFEEMEYKGGRKSLSLAQCEQNAREIEVKANFIDWIQVLGK